MTVHDLQDLELSYAPPYGSAKDPVNYAGFVASNVLKGDMSLCHFEDLAPAAEGGQFLLDVRDPGELNNLADAHPEQAAALSALIRELAALGAHYFS